MCGLAGFTGRLDNRKRIIEKMMDRIVHRGPDMAGEYLGEGITLGFRRLSIIDLSEAGRQPMVSDDGSAVIVFNGEIYNYREMRDELRYKGHVFHAESDTEVLLHAWLEYGQGLLDRVRGMFSFAIWDNHAKTLFAARDFFGIKPFYYTMIGRNILFGSEIKSFLEYPEFVKRLNTVPSDRILPFNTRQSDRNFFQRGI